MPTSEIDHIRTRVQHRSTAICDALEAIGDDLNRPSGLDGWSCLTVACHLRYGAQATRQMVDATLAGRPSAFYPAGRDAQRDATLKPALGEAGDHVPQSLRDACAELDTAVDSVDHDMWDVCTMPAVEGDLGAISLRDLLTLRLTEVEVHGLDLDLGLDAWDEAFGSIVLRQRLERARFVPDTGATSIAVAVDSPTTGKWVLDIAADGSSTVRSNGPADVRLVAPANVHVALLVGRPATGEPTVEGDAVAASSYLTRVHGP